MGRSTICFLSFLYSYYINDINNPSIMPSSPTMGHAWHCSISVPYSRGLLVGISFGELLLLLLLLLWGYYRRRMKGTTAVSVGIVAVLAALVSGLPWMSRLQSLLTTTAQCEHIRDCVDLISLASSSINEGEQEASVYTFLPLVKMEPKVHAVAVKVAITFPAALKDDIQICSDVEDDIMYLPKVRCGKGKSSSFGIMQVGDDGNTTYQGIVALFHYQFPNVTRGAISRAGPPYVVYIENHNVFLPSTIRWSMEVEKAGSMEILWHLCSIPWDHLLAAIEDTQNFVLETIRRMIDQVKIMYAHLSFSAKDPSVWILHYGKIPGCVGKTDSLLYKHRSKCHPYPAVEDTLRRLRELSDTTPVPINYAFLTMSRILTRSCHIVHSKHIFTIAMAIAYSVIYFGALYAPIVHTGSSLSNAQIWGSAFSHADFFHLFLNLYCLVALSGDLHWVCSCNWMVMAIAYIISMYFAAIVPYVIWRFVFRKTHIALVGASGSIFGILALVIMTQQSDSNVYYLLWIGAVALCHLLLFNRLVDVFGHIGGYLGGCFAYYLLQHMEILGQSESWMSVFF
eukprot:gb/GECG01002320.1/.p1 GENE.gb/GECG01002320.1/~~gb/GECG01002320.1/.p1  ORF type:complete len:568 (+),score=25.46 gb/GECG01002320.1/:1-1704(+)